MKRFYFNHFTLWLIIFLCLAENAPAQCWKLQTPSFPHETINDIYFTDSLNGFLAVNAGIIGRTTNGGNTWVPLETPSYQNLKTITAASSSSIWCGGEGGTLLHATDGGFHWQQVNLNDLVTLRASAFPSLDSGFVCGDSCIFRTVNGGATWTRQALQSAPWQATNLTYLKFFSKDTGYAYSSGRLLKTYNAGTTWTATSVSSFNMIAFATKAIGFAVGHSGNNDNYYKTTDGGLTWSSVGTVQNLNPQPNDMFVLDSMNVYILNNGNGTGNTRVYHTANGGQSWQNNNFIQQINWGTAIWFTSPNTGHVADLWGSCRKTYDRAATWATPPNDYNGSGAAIYAQDSTHIWQTGNVFQKRTADGGVIWILSNTSYYLVKLQFRSLTKGYALTDANNLATTVNGGQNWSINSAAGTINDFSFFSPTFGIVAKNNSVSKTLDGGQNWSSISIPSSGNFQQIAYGDSLHWFAVCNNNGSFKIYKSADAGATWNPACTISPTISIIKALVVSDSNHIYFSTGIDGVYRSIDGGQSFQQWGTVPNDPVTNPLSRMSVADTDKAFVISPMNLVNTSFQNIPRLFRYASGNWQVSPIHSSFPFVDIHYSDTTAWLTTLFGTIYRYYPAGSCPPDVISPFLNISGIVACAGSNFTVSVANYASYNIPYDTVKATLLSGNNVLWTGTPNAVGQFSVPVPTTSGSYQLKVTVSNPQIPNGYSIVIPVTPQFTSPPSLTLSYSQCNSGCCAGTSVTMGISNVNLGTGYTYELHKLNKNGTDSIVALNQLSSTLYNTYDTFKLYYKVNLGAGICYPSQIFYSDTVTFNIIQPSSVSASLSSTAIAGYVCAGDSVIFKTTSINAGIPSGRYYQFYRITPTGPQLLNGNIDSTFTLSALNGSISVYCRMFPGYGGCHVMDTATTDTLMLMTPANIAPSVTSSIGPDSLCQGKPLTVFLDTAMVTGFNHWVLWKKQNTTSVAVDSGAGNSYTDYSTLTPGVGYVFKVYYPGGCMLLSDTLHTHIISPQTAIIQLTPTEDIVAVPTNAIQYIWYRNGTFLTSTTSPLLQQPISGTYTLHITMPDSCIWLDGGPLSVNNTSSVANTSPSQWGIYPNPTSGNIWIKMPEQVTSADLAIYDMTGSLVYKASLSTPLLQPLNIRRLASGIYLLKIVSDKEIAQSRLEILPH